MEDLLVSIPPYIMVPNKRNGVECLFKSSICVKYLVGEDIWFCGYGTPRTSAHMRKLKYGGFGVTPLEAVENLIKEIRKLSKKK